MITLLIIKTLNTAVSVLYIAAAIGYGIYFFRNKNSIIRVVKPFLAATILLHIAVVVLIGLHFHHFPITSVYELLSMLALTIAIIYFYIGIKISVHSTGVFILLVVALCQTVSAALRSYTYDVVPIIKSIYVIIHTIAIAFGYSAFVIAMLYGFMYLLLFHTIKVKHFGIFFDRLPSLEQLDEMNYRASSIGFFAMTVSLIVAGIWLSKMIKGTSIFDPKIIVALVTWALFGANFILKKFFGSGGILTSYLSFFGFTGIIFSMVIVNVFLPTFHMFF
jgi:ABC-type transport system involved in cytochrome c biogenesis permease subunit